MVNWLAVGFVVFVLVSVVELLYILMVCNNSCADLRGLQNLEHPGSLQKLTPANFVETFSSNRGLLKLAALLDKTAGNCDAEQVVGWSCEFCDSLLKPDSVYASDSSVNKSKTAACTFLVYGDVCVLSFRGSKTVYDWFNDTKVFLKELPGDWGCQDAEAQVHGGFLEHWNTLSSFVQSTAAELSQRNAQLRFLVTGHSLGGAVGTLAVLALPKSKVLGCLSFESPRVFNAEAAAFYTSQGIPTLRVTRHNDVVVHSPKLPGFQFVHVGDELYLKQGQYTYCPRSDLSKCSEQDTFSLELANHCNFRQFFDFDFCECGDGKVVRLLRFGQALLLLSVVTGLAYLFFWASRRREFAGPPLEAGTTSLEPLEADLSQGLPTA